MAWRGGIGKVDRGGGGGGASHLTAVLSGAIGTVDSGRGGVSRLTSDAGRRGGCWFSGSGFGRLPGVDSTGLKTETGSSFGISGILS